MTAEKRVEKYEKTTEHGIKKVDELKKTMGIQHTKQAFKLSDVDKRVSLILDRYGIFGNMRIGYINFARSLFRVCRNQLLRSATTIAESEIKKYVAMGLDRNILTEIAKSLGIYVFIPPPGAFYHEFCTLGTVPETWNEISYDPPDTIIVCEACWLDIYHPTESSTIEFRKWFEHTEIETKIYVPIPDLPSTTDIVYTTVTIWIEDERGTFAVGEVKGVADGSVGERYAEVSVTRPGEWIGRRYRPPETVSQKISPADWKTTGIAKMRIVENVAYLSYNDIAVSVKISPRKPLGFVIFILHTQPFPKPQRAKINYVLAKK